MNKSFQAIKGMPDILPEETFFWQHLESILRSILNSYGYQELRTPLIESSTLFKRSMGEITDVVEKEMYTFLDKNGESISLRPEGTAGCVRACVEHGLIHRQEQRLWYMGPMFRHEKPQKGRYRQFTQLGVEVFGLSGLSIELELLMMSWSLWNQLGISEYLCLELNTLGTLSERQVYREHLVAYFEGHNERLDEDSKRRLYKNPLRILDSKHPETMALIEHAPRLYDYLGEASQSYFTGLCQGLTGLNIPFKVNPTLVRGLDYYEHTVFEWTTDRLGSQGTICAGGRFDPLVELIGGQSIPAVGFGLGVERLILLLKEVMTCHKPRPFIYCVVDKTASPDAILSFTQTLRTFYPKSSIFIDWSAASFKSQFKKADKSGARFALIFGAEEMANHHVTIKDLRVEQDQRTVSLDLVPETIAIFLEKGEVECPPTLQKKNN